LRHLAANAGIGAVAAGLPADCRLAESEAGEGNRTRYRTGHSSGADSTCAVRDRGQAMRWRTRSPCSMHYASATCAGTPHSLLLGHACLSSSLPRCNDTRRNTMNSNPRFALTALALAGALLAAPAFAVDAHHPKQAAQAAQGAGPMGGPQGGGMMMDMSQMHDMMKQMHGAKTPEERQKLRA